MTWDMDKDWKLLDYFEKGFQTRYIATKLRVSHHAVSYRLREMGCISGTGKRRSGMYTAAQVGRVFFSGTVPLNAIYRWLKEGSIKGVRTRRRRGSFAWIAKEELLRFLERRDKWMYWIPEDIADNEARAYATSLRSGIRWRWLTARDAASLLICAPRTVVYYIETGMLPALREHGRWWIRSDHAEWLGRNLHLLPTGSLKGEDRDSRIALIRARLEQMDTAPMEAA